MEVVEVTTETPPKRGETPQKKLYDRTLKAVTKAWGDFGGETGDRVTEKQTQAVLTSEYRFALATEKYAVKNPDLPYQPMPSELLEELRKAQDLSTLEEITAAVSFFGKRKDACSAESVRLNYWHEDSLTPSHLARHGMSSARGEPPPSLPSVAGITSRLTGTHNEKMFELSRQQRAIDQTVTMLQGKVRALEPTKTRL